MLRTALYALACLPLCACVTNNQSNTAAQLAPGSFSPAPTPNAQPRRIIRATPAALLSGAKMVTINKTTASGATLSLTTVQSLARDCSPLGHVDAKIVAAPDHGDVTIKQGTAFSNYSPADPPYLCNARRTPATLITYRSAPGYTGEDTTSVQVFFPDGKAPTLLFHIDVH